MRILNPDRAVIEPAKLRDYLLSPTHPVGRFKAPFFLALGYSGAEWSRLEADIPGQHLPREAVPAPPTPYGQKYIIRDTLVGPGGRVVKGRHRLGRSGRRGLFPLRDGIPRGRCMMYRVLDTVVLNRDLSDQGLRRGDLGAIVEVYEPDGVEVEFVTASGRTVALVTLTARDIRPVADDDLVSVRPSSRSA